MVDKVKETQRREREVNLRENDFWLGVLENYYSNGLDPKLILQHEQLIGSLTPASLKAVGACAT